jgi:hypothetical protein
VNVPEPSAVLVQELARSVLISGEGDKLQWVEGALLREALRLTSGNKAAARLLEIHRKSIERRLDRLFSAQPQDADGDSMHPDEGSVERSQSEIRSTRAAGARGEKAPKCPSCSS